MVIVKKLAAKFQIQFIAKLGNPFLNVLRLYPQILFIIKTILHNGI